MLEAIMSFLDRMIERLEKFPRSSFLALSLFVNAYLLTRLEATHDHESERADKDKALIVTGFSKADTASSAAIRALQDKSVLQDSMLIIKDREYQRLLQNKQPQ